MIDRPATDSKGNRMARPQSLIPGAIFFIVYYYDDELLVPDIQTLEYHSQEVEDGKKFWLFCEPGAAEEPAPKEMALIQFDESQLYQLLSIDELLGVVKELRYVIRGEAETSEAAEPRVVPDRSMLTARVSTFLSSSSRSLQIGIRYTDDGLSLQKNAQQGELLLTMNPLREPEKNHQLDQFVRTRNLQAREDYLASKGRKRAHIPDRLRRAGSDNGTVRSLALGCVRDAPR